jgi:hypothetical protein
MRIITAIERSTAVRGRQHFTIKIRSRRVISYYVFNNLCSPRVIIFCLCIIIRVPIFTLKPYRSCDHCCIVLLSRIRLDPVTNGSFRFSIILQIINWHDDIIIVIIGVDNTHCQFMNYTVKNAWFITRKFGHSLSVTVLMY